MRAIAAMLCLLLVPVGFWLTQLTKVGDKVQVTELKRALAEP